MPELGFTVRVIAGATISLSKHLEGGWNAAGCVVAILIWGSLALLLLPRTNSDHGWRQRAKATTDISTFLGAAGTYRLA